MLIEKTVYKIAIWIGLIGFFFLFSCTVDRFLYCILSVINLFSTVKSLPHWQI